MLVRSWLDPPSVAGIAEQVPAVVDPLVDRVAGREGDGALVGADEEEADDGEQPEEERPGEDLPDGNRGDLETGPRDGYGRRLRHVSSSGIRASLFVRMDADLRV